MSHVFQHDIRPYFVESITEIQFNYHPRLTLCIHVLFEGGQVRAVEEGYTEGWQSIAKTVHHCPEEFL